MNAGEGIRYGAAGASVASFQQARVSAAAFDDVLAVLRAEITASGLWVLHEIDPQAILQRADHAIGLARQILFFHPDMLVRVLQADQAALLEAPLKFAVLGLPDGTVSIRWNDPAAAFARYGNPALEVLGQELAAICKRIAGVAASAGALSRQSV